ncbi:UNVERIFIED_CONTAM: UDP-glucose flavonoid 3-O-glucosyltransferase 6 [Sesamum angustifolium]|uniref:UDP-glucose flavonoid 3-O-glucosyltransferase 6 n=1 Tax=Sesamum angustifolium TaxID=2727405 RepID=A0AAW2QQR7_9LAMI
MSEAKNLARLVFIPLPAISHLKAAVKLAKLLADRDECLSITVLIMRMPSESNISSYIKNSSDSRVNFVELPENESILTELMKSPKNFLARFVESQKDLVRDAVVEIIKSSSSSKISGFVIDMFCTSMIDVANGLGIPTYVFVSSGAAALGLMLHLQSLRDDSNLDLTKYKNSDAEISVPTHCKPVPATVWPSSVFDKESDLLDFVKRYRETAAIIVNSFLEFESHQIRSLSNNETIPPIYPFGPILEFGEDQTDAEKQNHRKIFEWLDRQPRSSVVFLCFGSKGCFDEDQVKEIAVALENSRHRFLWSLRKPPSGEKNESPGEYENPEEVLPQGFLQRTVEIGKVIGWAPQIAVLSHPAVGGFVSHCGWNSTLESVWCGVEIKMDYRKESGVIVGADTIEKAIKQLMDPENEIRDKMRALKEKSRMALMEGGSSCNYLKCFVENVMKNIS